MTDVIDLNAHKKSRRVENPNRNKKASNDRRNYIRDEVKFMRRQLEIIMKKCGNYEADFLGPFSRINFHTMFQGFLPNI